MLEALVGFNFNAGPIFPKNILIPNSAPILGTSPHFGLVPVGGYFKCDTLQKQSTLIFFILGLFNFSFKGKSNKIIEELFG